MSFGQAIGAGFRGYVAFSGRASRSEFWWWVLFTFIFSIVSSGLDAILGSTPVIYLLYYLAMLLPSRAVAVRRLHDTDRSGWWILIGLIPFIGGIILLIWFVGEGTRGQNRFGGEPS